MTDHTFTTIASALTFARQARKKFPGKKVCYHVPVRFDLPTTEGKAFPGFTYLTVTRKQFLKVIEDMGTILVDERGGKVMVKVDNETPSNLVFISL